MRQWEEGAITTFEFILSLNYFGGRSYHRKNFEPRFPGDMTVEDLVIGRDSGDFARVYGNRLALERNAGIREWVQEKFNLAIGERHVEQGELPVQETTGLRNIVMFHFVSEEVGFAALQDGRVAVVEKGRVVQWHEGVLGERWTRGSVFGMAEGLGVIRNGEALVVDREAAHVVASGVGGEIGAGDRRRIVVVGDAVEFVSVDTGKRCIVALEGGEEAACVDVNDSRKLAAVGLRSGRVLIFQGDMPCTYAVSVNTSMGVRRVMVTKKWGLVVCEEEKGQVKVFSPNGGAKVSSTKSRRRDVRAWGTWSGPDGEELVATGGEGGAVRIWDAGSGREVEEGVVGQETIVGVRGSRRLRGALLMNQDGEILFVRLTLE